MDQQSAKYRKYDKSYTKRCKDYCRTFVAFLFSNVGIIGLVVGYTMAGAIMFRTIERSHNYKVKTEVENIKKETAKNLWFFATANNPYCAEKDKEKLVKLLITFQNKIVKCVNEGYDGSRLEYSAQWSIAGSFLYSLTVITTIGYGNIFPHTIQGKIVTIVYAIIGMPLFLLYLSNIGDVMARSFKWIYANLCLCRWCPGVAKRRALRAKEKSKIRMSDFDEEISEHNFQTDMDYPEMSATSGLSEVSTEESYDVHSVTVPVTVCLMIMVGYICGGAILFCKWENWEFLEAAYFCFISLSTIGFGDLVPGDSIISHKETGNLLDEIFDLSFVFCAMYLMLGMALIAMCFNLMQEEVVNKIRTTIDTVKYILTCKR